MTKRIVSIGRSGAGYHHAGAFSHSRRRTPEPPRSPHRTRRIAANFIVAARNLGIEVSAAGAVGDDAYGAQILAPLRERGVDLSSVVVTPGSTSTIVITLTDRQSGEHVFLGNYGEGPEIPYPKGLDARIDQADALFLSGYTLVEKRIVPMTLRAVEYAHKRDKPIYYGRRAAVQTGRRTARETGAQPRLSAVPDRRRSLTGHPT